ncbi:MULTISPECIES: hypothetical protein [unclassified Tolypothrix]|uniref:hypothetical protein n=1 Tax=unclassified Tolypothrix TaxID=2649714 RepID=UPI000AF62ACF|nr:MULTISPECIES: hypothetical protein [unclassified Tolypothrix]MBE9087096.1 hypothetical protein [Tolypothrix sp. LEGE 11397]UYD26365.1 hypothetical protein HGR01_34630 [Tolypothrix sp. PCC 7712]UYD31398.1 hypothetical protein HG267_19870 [Tolypothrix sp. PCC 7601]BAY92404.1 hypothetical protein NIES3275_44390 [Microchaete diplosiphon NIES-3275]
MFYRLPIKSQGQRYAVPLRRKVVRKLQYILGGFIYSEVPSLALVTLRKLHLNWEVFYWDSDRIILVRLVFFLTKNPL